MSWLSDSNKMYANKVDYFKNQKALGLSDRALIQKLADDYCDAKDSGDQEGMNNYMAGLMLKFWKDIHKMQTKCVAIGHMDYEDFYSQLFYCIDNACNYRAWRDPNKNTNAQACINASISARGAAEILYFSNRDKYKANYCAASLDTPINSDSDDHETTLGDMLVGSENGAMYGYKATSIVQRYVMKGDLVKAIILDNIAFGDSMKYSKEVEHYTDSEGEDHKVSANFREFSSRKLVQLLLAPESDYENYFVNKYHAGKEETKLAIENITNSKNQKLYKQIENTVKDLREYILATHAL